MPESLPCIGFLRGSQPFQSPTTETESAFGAQTAKCVASPAFSSLMKCAPSFSYRRLCVPSRKRYWSCPVMVTVRSATVGMGVGYLKRGRGLLPCGHINFDYADRLRSAVSVRKPRHSRSTGLPDRSLAADAARQGVP